MREYLTQASYLLAAILFILGLRGLTSPRTARRGMQLAEAGMLFAIIGTLIHHDIVSYEWIIIGMVIGSAIGLAMALLTPMTKVPELTALSHMFGAVAAVLVGIVEYERHPGGIGLSGFVTGALGFEVLFGALTVTGSFMAFTKLQGLVTSAPITYRLQNVSNILLLVLAFAAYVYLIGDPSSATVFYTLLVMGILIGILIVLPIGGADMPVVLSLLNSYAGLAAAATGFAIGNVVLVIVGALNGTSGFLLSMLMSKAMNRSLTSVIFGAFGKAPEGVAASMEGKMVKDISAEDAAILLAYARGVVFVPGYGMAVSQAQHQVRELAAMLEERGVEVKYAIHPVAGRMPGHMNVLLAEANVPYPQLVEMEEINPELPRTDVAVVIGANDVVNPAARHDTSSPIYGMPIIDVDKAKTVIVMKRSMGVGFAGIDNELFYLDNTRMLFGDAKKMLTALIQEIKAGV